MYAPQGLPAVFSLSDGEALMRRRLQEIIIPLFYHTRAKTRENGAFYGSRPARNAGKTIGFRETDR